MDRDQRAQVKYHLQSATALAELPAGRANRQQPLQPEKKT